VGNKYEEWSYKIIIASAGLIFLGVLGSTFVSAAIVFGILGAVLTMVGILIFIVSQFLEEEKKEEKVA